MSYAYCHIVGDDKLLLVSTFLVVWLFCFYWLLTDKPIATWRDFKSGETLLTVRWSHSRPSVFFVLDSSSAVLTFDLVENGLAPVKMDRISLSK